MFSPNPHLMNRAQLRRFVKADRRREVFPTRVIHEHRYLTTPEGRAILKCHLHHIHTGKN